MADPFAPEQLCISGSGQEVVLPDDVVEQLSRIPGIWELAAEMGFTSPSTPQASQEMNQAQPATAGLTD